MGPLAGTSVNALLQRPRRLSLFIVTPLRRARHPCGRRALLCAVHPRANFASVLARNLILCACASFAPLLHCGARAELIVRGGNTIALPDASMPDARVADGALSDASAASCSLGPTVVLKRRMEPSFLLSLTAMPNGGYAYTMASGWNGLASPALVTVDANLMETAAIATTRLLTVHAVTGDDRLYAVTSERDSAMGMPVEHAFYRTNPRLEAQPLGALCMGCTVRDRPAVLLDRSIAVPMSTGALGSGGAVLVAKDTGVVGASLVGMDMQSPAVLATSGGLFAVSQRGDGPLARLMFDPSGAGVRALSSVNVGFDGISPPWLVRLANAGVVAVGMARGGGRTVPITMAQWASDAALTAAVPDVLLTVGAAGATAGQLSAAAHATRPMIAIAWGEQIGEQSGASLSVVDARGAPLLEQQVVSEPTTNSQSYTIYTAVAPHPEGFVVAWSGWQRQANYAIYARVVRCP